MKVLIVDEAVYETFVEQLVGHSVYLQLQVKAAPKWRRNATMLERLGL